MARAGAFPWRIFTRLFAIQTGLILLALLVSGVSARYFFKRQFIAELEDQLRHALTGLSHFLPAAPEKDWCASTAKNTNYRLTLISDRGVVLCDSEYDAESMDNHSNRPEVMQAATDGFGQTVRFSQTLQTDMLYGALNVPSQHHILRGAIPLSSLSKTLQVIDHSLVLFLGAVAVFLIFMGVWAARNLLEPLTALMRKVQSILEQSPEAETLESVRRSSYGEWSKLEEYLNDIQKELETKIDALKFERERQSTIMNSISDAIVAVDRSGRILFHNDRLRDVCGQSDARNMSYWELFRLPEILEAFAGAIHDKKYVTTPAVCIARDGADRFYSVAVAPLLRGAELTGAVAVFHDVSDLKRAEQMRIDFVANVSHELRTPLTAIKGYSDTLLEDLKTGRAVDPQFVTPIVRNSDRLMTLVEDLLDLSSLESTEILNREHLSTEEVTNRVLGQLKGVFESKRHHIAASFAASRVFADHRRLEQVLVNLLDNAAKYTPPGGEIRVIWRLEPGASELEVQDTGPGIPSEYLSRLFERFYRVDKARSRDLGGSGLGLAIVKHIMQRHGGSVSVKSTVGKGSSFVCRFPEG